MNRDIFTPHARIPEHENWMRQALDLAQLAGAGGDVPIGALIIGADGEVLGRGYNRREQDQDPVAHAEVLAIREAAQKLGRWRLEDCTLVVTVEPCSMCAGAILNARIPRVIFGAWEEKMGASGSQYDLLRDGRLPYTAEVYVGVLHEECSEVVKDFFRKHR